MQNKKIAGLTLIALLIILAIVAVLLILLLRNMSQNTFRSNVDKTAAQMQQILNAGMSYYVTEPGGHWPGTQGAIHPNTNLFALSGSNDLQPKYLPVGSGAGGAINNPWGQGYWAAGPDRQTFTSNVYDPVTKKTTKTNIPLSISNTFAPSPFFYVYTFIPATPASPSTATAADIANAIAGKLPNSYTSKNKISSSSDPGLQGLPDPATPCNATSNCYVVAAVNIPGLNMSNATGVREAQIYRHNDCVLQPTCPNDVQGNPMHPQITLIPTSVSGVTDATSKTVAPITSFTAYAINDLRDPIKDSAGRANQAGSPPNCLAPGDVKTAEVGGVVATGSEGTVPVNCTDPITREQLPTGRYWRVCLQLKTNISEVSGAEIKNVNVLAVVNCVVNSSMQPDLPGSIFTIDPHDKVP